MDDGESSSTNNSSRPWESYNTVFTNAKAGMEAVDKEKVQRIVYEMSKGSKYFQNEERKEALMKQKIEHMRDRSAKLSFSDLSNYQKVVDRRILELEATRDLSSRVYDSKPEKRCKRDQKKSSVGNAKVKKIKVGEQITALQQLVSPYGKDDEDTGDVNPTMNVKELKSNGLCLVPLAWTVHVANTNGADLWSPAILSPTMNQ